MARAPIASPRGPRAGTMPSVSWVATSSLVVPWLVLACGATPTANGALGSGGAIDSAGSSSVAGASATSAGAGGATSVGGSGTSSAGAAAGGMLGASGSAVGGMPTGVAGSGVAGSGGTSMGGASVGGASGAGNICEAFVMPPDCTVPENAVLPGELRCTGLYESWDTKQLRCGVTEYEPAHVLWSDGLAKTRYVWLPPGAQVDVTDPDDFRYPVGTLFWKEFRFVDGDGERLAETRFMRREEGGWLYTTYVWSEDGSQAVQQNDGVDDLHGSGHTVPTRDQCKDCHGGRPDFILGWDALMLGEGATGLTRADLLARDLVTWQGRESGAPSPLDLEIPGDDVERAALGYLHANCGISCHNDTNNALALEPGFFTRLDADTLADVQTTDVMTTGFERTPNPNAPLSELPEPPGGGDYVDLRPLDTERSLILVRMKLRGEDAAMPLIGTNVVDDVAVTSIEQWIGSMTTERGYPAPEGP